MVTRPLSQKFLISALVAIGLYLIVLGAQRLYERHQVKKISLEFVKALQSGNESQIRSLLTPEKSDLAKSLKQESQDSRASIDYRFFDVKITGSTAQVSIQIQKDGYAIKPDIHLVKSRTGVWKVDSITQAKVDPLWYDQKDKLYREKLEKEKVAPAEVEGRVLAKGLARALNTTVEESPPDKVNP